MIAVSLVKLPHGEGLPLPSYATSQSAGVDLMAAIKDPILLKPLERKLIPTGISLALPEGYEAQIRPRSGLALKHGLTVLNSPGTIDADYRGEIQVILINLGTEDFLIERGLRIAQLILSPISTLCWEEVDHHQDFAHNDRQGGFGSTGLRNIV
ncbi:MAG: deoxyuridine 5'-triphosphate nucleotidohydrolase [Alphaproteobacteria bacterium 41-28]|nr:MAG: deoxyuridine 5'-triphosphate nucleotidohydrolase [Alphaproteobacteria bacterium 41-28]